MFVLPDIRVAWKFEIEELVKYYEKIEFIFPLLTITYMLFNRMISHILHNLQSSVVPIQKIGEKKYIL